MVYFICVRGGTGKQTNRKPFQSESAEWRAWFRIHFFCLCFSPCLMHRTAREWKKQCSNSLFISVSRSIFISFVCLLFCFGCCLFCAKDLVNLWKNKCFTFVILALSSSISPAPKNAPVSSCSSLWWLLSSKGNIQQSSSTCCRQMRFVFLLLGSVCQANMWLIAPLRFVVTTAHKRASMALTCYYVLSFDSMEMALRNHLRVHFAHK